MTTPAPLDVPRFTALLRAELGLDVDDDDLDTPFDRLAGWDSVMLLRLLGAAEPLTGRRAPMIAVLEATDLRGVHAALTR